MAQQKSARRSQLPFTNTLQFLVELNDVEPVIWRRIQIPETFVWADFHTVLQAAMGWGMEHDHEFVLEQRAGRSAKDSTGDMGAKRVIDMIKVGETFDYFYDPEDKWHHRITFEERVPRNQYMTYPICVGGENACPPEQCGGPEGYVDLLNGLADETSEEHAEIMEWTGGFFDPTGFDVNYVNQELLWPLTEEIL